MNALAQARATALRQSVTSALSRWGWDVKATAAALGIHRTYLHRLIKRFGLLRPARLLSLEGGGECSGVFQAADDGWVEVEAADGKTWRFSLTSGRSDDDGCPWRIDRSRIPNGLPAPMEAAAA